MEDWEESAAYTELTDRLIAAATKEQIADVARLLALNIGWYHARYGEVPQEVLISLLQARARDAQTRELIRHGLQNLVSALAEVTGLADEDEAVH